MTLPVKPTGKLGDIIESLQASHGEAVDPLLGHLIGGTSADWLAETLTEAGLPIGPTTIKAYRRKLRAATQTKGV